ncbi:MAG: hypothetical protein COT15_02675, partial [Candidatus Diapherotrites archaeon CG08_land_8_20_14_0_20_34_12]
QIAGIACLENEGKILEENKRIWKTRVSFSDNQLRKMGFNFVSPDAGIYLFATHENIKESKSFAYSLLDEGVAVAPNLGFGNYDTFIRICPNQDIAVLKEAFELMEKVLSK